MKRPQARQRALSAKTADKYQLYQRAVQSPQRDVHFMARIYKNLRGRPARHFREDFCGTALLSATWVKRGPQYTAEGFDIDPVPLAWGRQHNLEPLGVVASRVLLHQEDVRHPSHRSPDIRCAQNFSYCVFKQRAELVQYLRTVREDLASDGIFLLDVYGGPDSMNVTTERNSIEAGFTYIWEQREYWPVTGETKCYIHFRFRDGTRMNRAFAYDWRLWTVPEVKDALMDAGFPTVECYWEGTDKNGRDGNGIFRKTRVGENCDAFIAYLAAYS